MKTPDSAKLIATKRVVDEIATRTFFGYCRRFHCGHLVEKDDFLQEVHVFLWTDLEDKYANIGSMDVGEQGRIVVRAASRAMSRVRSRSFRKISKSSFSLDTLEPVLSHQDQGERPEDTVAASEVTSVLRPIVVALSHEDRLILVWYAIKKLRGADYRPDHAVVDFCKRVKSRIPCSTFYHRLSLIKHRLCSCKDLFMIPRGVLAKALAEELCKYDD